MDTKNFPSRIRARDPDPDRIADLKKTWNAGGVRGGQLVINDLPARRAGFPVLDLDDFVQRANAGEDFTLWPQAGWHTTTVLQDLKAEKQKPASYRLFSLVFLASELTEQEMVALGKAQNNEEIEADKNVSRSPALL